MARQRKDRRQPAAAAPPTHIAPGRALQIVTLLLTVVCLAGIFSAGIEDTDFWWHLKTGQYIAQRHELPFPDPFAYTSSAAPAYAGEAQVRRFNLTHEWLSQLGMYAAYAAAGFPAIVLLRILLLTGLCALAGVLAARLVDNFYAGIAAACATASVMVAFVADRPGIVSFLGVAVFIVLLEWRRGWWALPPLAVIWANCHGGFVLGWVVLMAYCADSLLRRPLAKWMPENRRLWLAAALSIAASGINPNGFAAAPTLLAYRHSTLTRNLIEWQPPRLWGAPYGFDLLLYATTLTLLLSWRKVRPAHWLLFAAFAAASLSAFRNIPLIGFLGPVLIAAYFPFRIAMPRALAWTAPVLLAAALAGEAAQGRFSQPGVAAWTIPSGAADFLLAHQITGPLFNTYEQGGYLIWSTWPQERVFIDGRSLSESVYRDYQQILFNAGSPSDQITGPRAELLNRYGVQVVVMNTMESVSGAMYPFALALANPAGQDWQLVYDDAQAVVFLRHPPPEIPVLSNKLGRTLRHMDNECTAYIENSPDTPLCARTLARYWLANGVKDEARRMLQLYLSHAPGPDREAERMLLGL